MEIDNVYVCIRSTLLYNKKHHALKGFIQLDVLEPGCDFNVISCSITDFKTYHCKIPFEKTNIAL